MGFIFATGGTYLNKMKRIIIIALLVLGVVNLSAASDGYHIRLKIPGVKDTMVYLVHYYGKTLPTIYKRDSAHIDKNGNAVLSLRTLHLWVVSI